MKLENNISAQLLYVLMICKKWRRDVASRAGP